MTELRLVVAAALVDDLETPTRMLAARRSKPAQIAGRWEFTGGKVESGESPERALHRELHEELGIKVALGKEIVGPDNGGWIITDRHIMRLWYARITEGEPHPLVEHDLLEWAEPTNLRGYNWLDGDVRIIEHIEREHSQFQPVPA
jgi:8-oxo-dGTP diphosphatase